MRDSCLGKRPEVERRVDSSSTSEAASRLLGRAKRQSRAESLETVAQSASVEWKVLRRAKRQADYLDEPSGRSATKETLATAGTQESRADS